MKPDLKACHAFSMQFNCVTNVSNEIVSAIRASSTHDKDGDFLFIKNYDSTNSWAWVDKPKRSRSQDTYRVKISFYYDLEKEKVPPPGTKSIDELLDILRPCTEQISFDCNIMFEYPKKLKTSTIISIPLKWTDSVEMPFNIIQGLHLVKLENNKRLYDIQLEAFDDGNFGMSLNFNQKLAISEQLADQVLSFATNIARRFTEC
jgi:hypothetical protein